MRLTYPKVASNVPNDSINPGIKSYLKSDEVKLAWISYTDVIKELVLESGVIWTL